MKIKPISLLSSLSVAILVLALVVQVLIPFSASAAQITSRNLVLKAGTTDGGSKAGGVVNHEFTFSLPSSTAIGSIKFDYCTTASGPCTMPTGLVTTSATLNSATGPFTGATLTNTTNGSPYIAKASASTITPGSEVVQLNNITNPTTNNYTFYVRIASFGSTDGTGSPVDTGTVAASTAEPIILTGTMPESLVFCTGETIGVTLTVPDCASVGTTDGTIGFNQLFSPTDTATATSQMAASTNAGAGYAITVNGPTLTSGANTVTPLSSPTTIARGVSQFGMNLKLNTTATSTVPVGAEIAVPSNGTNYRGQATTGYNVVDNFKFISGDIVADSSNGGPGGSDAQIYTVSYVVNVPGSQPAGTYTTTLTYICTPTF